jgi:hypothetical protein
MNKFDPLRLLQSYDQLGSENSIEQQQWRATAASTINVLTVGASSYVIIR